MYTTGWCGYCHRAKRLLEQRGLDYEEVSVDDEPEFRRRLLERTGRWTVPQVIIDGEPIGGFDELSALDRTSALEELLR
jgi:glutaredoxin 3